MVTPTLPPVHMRRNGFDPVPELGEIRRDTGVQSVLGALGNQAYLVTRYEDVKTVLADHEHFANSRPPGFVTGPKAALFQTAGGDFPPIR